MCELGQSQIRDAGKMPPSPNFSLFLASGGLLNWGPDSDAVSSFLQGPDTPLTPWSSEKMTLAARSMQ